MWKQRAFDDVTLYRLIGLWLAYAAFALAAGRRRLPTVCPFRLLTGHRCPLCGLTRSVNCLMRGEIRRSFREHRVGPVLFAGSGLLLAHAWRGEAIYPGRPQDGGGAGRGGRGHRHRALLFRRRLTADRDYLCALAQGRRFTDPRLTQRWLRATHTRQLRYASGRQEM